MPRDNISVLEALHACWKGQDVDGVLACCTADICFVAHAPPDVVGVGGCMLGKAELRSYLTALCRTWEFVEIAPGPFHVDGDRIRELTHFRARLRETGDELEGSKRHIWTFRNGLISECQEFQDTHSIRTFIDMFARLDITRRGRPGASRLIADWPAGMPLLLSKRK